MFVWAYAASYNKQVHQFTGAWQNKQVLDFVEAGFLAYDAVVSRVWDNEWKRKKYMFLYFISGDGNWRKAEAWNLLLAGAVEVNALVQGALRQFTQWHFQLRIEHSTFQLRGGQSTTELSPPIK